MSVGKRGFTLIEVMVATAVLATGVVLIFEAFFASLDAYNTYRRYMIAFNWMDERIWQAQDALMREGQQAQFETTGDLVLEGMPFKWKLSRKDIDGEAALYGCDLELSWKQGARTIRLGRTGYAFQQVRQEEDEDE